MARRAFKLAAGLVLILATLTPLVECFDHWDHNVTPTNDTELSVTAWFVGAGIVLTLAKLLRYVPALASSNRVPSELCQASFASRLGADNLPAPTGSPPLISLRI